jgi:predicted nucleic acid-binding protein
MHLSIADHLNAKYIVSLDNGFKDIDTINLFALS